MVNYPYTLKTGSLKKFLDTIPYVGVPDKVSQKLLWTLDFKSSNDRSIVTALRFLKFIDDSGAPAERYKQYRDKEKSRAVMGTAVRDAYQELFKVYPDADQKDHQALQNFFSTQTGLGHRAVKATAETFRALCSLSDFDAIDTGDAIIPQQERPPSTIGGKANTPNGHLIERVLSEGRTARIMMPDDVTPEEIEKVKRLLDAFK